MLAVIFQTLTHREYTFRILVASEWHNCSFVAHALDATLRL